VDSRAQPCGSQQLLVLNTAPRDRHAGPERDVRNERGTVFGSSGKCGFSGYAADRQIVHTTFG
ncbi:hypothetical protein GWI33_001002, partial [Rhynchophorus ferrugineus]